MRSSGQLLNLIISHLSIIQTARYPARTFDTFRKFALDAGNSRFYGGIHYQPSINLGLKLRKIVGDNVVDRLSPNADLKNNPYS